MKLIDLLTSYLGDASNWPHGAITAVQQGNSNRIDFFDDTVVPVFVPCSKMWVGVPVAAYMNGEGTYSSEYPMYSINGLPVAEDRETEIVTKWKFGDKLESEKESPKVIYQKEYDGGSLYDVQRDMLEAFDPRFNQNAANIPQDDNGFHKGSFVVTVEWKPE